MEYDFFNQIDRKLIYLCKPNGNKICCLNGVDQSTTTLNDPLQSIAELTFAVNRYISYHDIFKQSNGYDSLADGMYLYLDGVGYFRMTEPVYNNDGSIETKQITAQSIEVELQDKDLVGWKVNCGSEDSLEYLADDNVDIVTNLAKEYVTFYSIDTPDKPRNPQLSMMDLILEKIPQWTFEFANDKSKELLHDKQYSFEADSQNIYDFLTQTVSTTAKCIFTFDRVKRIVKVSVVTDDNKTNYFGEDTNVLLSYRTLLDNVTISCTTDNVYTRFHVVGADDLTIEAINFGDPRIVNLNAFLSPMYFGTQECVNKYIDYTEQREILRKQYVKNLRQYRTLQLDIDELINRVPNDGCQNNWNTYGKEDLEQYLDYFQTLVDAFENDREYFVGGKFSEEMIQASPAWHDYKTYKYYIIPNIELAIGQLGVPTDDKQDLSDDWETDWDLYGRDELKNKMDAYKEKADMLKKQGFDTPYHLLTEPKKQVYTEKEYGIFYNNWNTYNQDYEDCKKAYEERCADIEQKQLEQEAFMLEMRDLQALVQLDNPKWGFTKEELLTIHSLYRDTDYKNENILITSLDDIVTTIDTQEELLADARIELDKVAHPQYQFNTTIGNLFLLPEFKRFHKYMKNGNFIRLNVRDNYTEKLRLIGMSYNPFMVDNTLEVTFSSMLTYNNQRNDFESLFSATASTAKNQITSNGSSTVNDNYANIQISNELLKAIANGSYFAYMMEQTKTEAVTQSISLNNFKGQFDSYMQTYMQQSVFKNQVQAHIQQYMQKYVEERLVTIEKSISDLTIRLDEIVKRNNLTNYVIPEETDDTEPTTTE